MRSSLDSVLRTLHCLRPKRKNYCIMTDFEIFLLIYVNTSVVQRRLQPLVIMQCWQSKNENPIISCTKLHDCFLYLIFCSLLCHLMICSCFPHGPICVFSIHVLATFKTCARFRICYYCPGLTDEFPLGDQ